MKKHILISLINTYYFIHSVIDVFISVKNTIVSINHDVLFISIPILGIYFKNYTSNIDIN